MAASCGLMCFRARAKNRNHHREHSSTAGRVPLWSVLLGVRRLLRMGSWDNEDGSLESFWNTRREVNESGQGSVGRRCKHNGGFLFFFPGEDPEGPPPEN